MFLTRIWKLIPKQALPGVGGLVLGLVLAAFVNIAPASAACLPDDCPPPEPEGGVVIVDVTQDVTGDIDSGVAGNYWATDAYRRHIRVWEFEDDPYVAVVTYEGAFTSVAGISPGATGEVGEGVTGSLTGGYTSVMFEGEFDPEYPTSGYIGAWDYGCDPATGECEDRPSWLDFYFEAVEGWDLYDWGFGYVPACPSNGSWVNAASGNIGDITGLPDLSCIPVPPPPAEWRPMYWQVDIYNPVPDQWLDYCFAIMPQGYVPTDEWRGQPDHCGWTGGEVVYAGWVSLDEDGNPHYGGPGWLPEYYNPDYAGLYHNLETWNQEYLDSVQ